MRRSRVETPKDPAIDWLLAGDPSICWQTMRDLTGSAENAVERERKKIACEGWGDRLLSLQDSQGKWGGGASADVGLYTPKWISTTYTMLLLRDFGLPQSNGQAQKACALLLDRGIQPDGGVSYGTWAKWTRRGETCITGMVLSILSYFRYQDSRLDTIAEHLLDQQMPDGGWNCRRPGGATHASMHTTISALEGLRLYELHRSRDLRNIRAAQVRGMEFLLQHHLFRSHRTGKIIKPEFLRFAFPPRWHFDILRGLDYFQCINAPRDRRLTEAVEIVRGRRSDEGLWPLEYAYRGKTYFDMESLKKPSRWNTLRALRVLKWWDRA